MDCRDAQERLSDYQDGSLPSDVAERVSRHLRECGECAAAARSLSAVRELLLRLPPAQAPPELLARVRDAVAREGTEGAAGDGIVPAGSPKRSLLSRLRIPLEAAAAVLLVASIYWYQKGTAPVSPPAASRAPAGVATPRPPAAPDRPAPRKESGIPAGETAALPTGSTERKVRAFPQADLPAAPAVRASTGSDRIVAAAPPASEQAAESPAFLPALPRDVAGEAGHRAVGSPRIPTMFAAPPTRLLLPASHVSEVWLEVTPGEREGAEDRIAAAARRLGGAVEEPDRAAPGGNAPVRVLLPESAASAFLAELERIGNVPAGGGAAGIGPPGSPPGTVAFAVRIRLR